MFHSPPIFLPLEIILALENGADLALGWSGGKDSQALLGFLTQWFRQRQFSGRLFAVHADLGRNDWEETSTFVQSICSQLDLPLVVVRREKGDLLARWQERMETLAGTGKPFWSSSAQRYCTSDLKRGPINKHLRWSNFIISCEGIRGQESDARKEKNPLTVRREITGQRYKPLSPSAALLLYLKDKSGLAGGEEVPALQVPLWEQGNDPEEDESSEGQGPRLALTWYPLFNWSLAEVWVACGTSQQELDQRRALYKEGKQQSNPALIAAAFDGWPCHPCYVRGTSRLSCKICSLGDLVNLEIGARENPNHYRELVNMEIASGCSFQPSRWLADVCPDLLTEQQQLALAQLPRRVIWLEKKLQGQLRRKTCV